MIHVPGLHGGDSVRQVHQADQQGGDNPVQHQRPDHPEERVILPLMQDRRHEVSIVQYGTSSQSDDGCSPK